MSESVSIIITCYNLEKYIAEAIESVLNQKFEGKMEIIVIDDFSTDNSANIIKRYSVVKYHRTSTNSGVLAATLLGLKLSSHQVILFLDGDDTWDINKVSTVFSYFKQNKSLALISHDLNYINHIGQFINMKNRVNMVMSNVPRVQFKEKIREGILMHKDYVWLGSAYAVHRHNGRIDEFCDFIQTAPDLKETYQDWPIAYWVASHSKELDYIPQKLFNYRIHGINYSGDASNAQKAIKNFKRALFTTFFLQAIANNADIEKRYKAATQRKIYYCNYLVELYKGRKFTILPLFIKSIAFIAFDRHILLKEMVRFVAIQFFGVELFIKMTKRWLG